MSTHNKTALTLSVLLAAGLGAGLQAAHAADDYTSNAVDPLYADGPYASLMGNYVHFDGDNRLDHGFGATLGGGYRRGPVGLELNGTYTGASGSGRLLGGSVDGLVFPFPSLPGLFGIAGVGLFNVSHYPGVGSTTFNVTAVEGGAGYLIPFHIDRYQFGIRAEALYRYGKLNALAEDQRPPNVPVAAPSNWHDIVINVGLQFPFGLLPPPPPPTPVKVAPLDSDGDGVTDDIDQCPGTPPNTKVDARGCALAPPPPPCQAPAPGERISLAGCGTGDVIILRGVNFEFNKAKLTVNAQTLLSDVAAQLKQYPDITVEIGGYTDSKGSDAYNQKLSQRRADAVKAYFLTQGITADRMTDVGYGETHPVADNGTDEGRELNRRVELKITGSDHAASTQVTAEPAHAAVETQTAPANDQSAPATASSVAAPTSDSGSRNHS